MRERPARAAAATLVLLLLIPGASPAATEPAAGSRQLATAGSPQLATAGSPQLATAGSRQFATAGSRQLAGGSLTEALRVLEGRGLAIVFTSELVRPEMRVETEPTSGEPRRALDEILAPHGLAAIDAEGGTVVVVRADPARQRPGAIAGRVRSRETGQPLAGAEVRVVEPGLAARTDADGRFELGGLPPGVYTVEAQLRGFLSGQADRVTVAGGGAAAGVDLALRPAPYVHDEIVVRPSRLSLLREEPAAPLSFDRQEIESLPHLGGDVFRALSLFPGVAANDVSARFSVHGGRRDEVLIVLDGQELYEAHHLQDYDGALSIVAPDGLDSVSLTTGAFPADRGDRMSGVLEMTTVTPTEPRRTRLSLSLLNAAATSGGTSADGRRGWLVSGRRGSIDLAGRFLGTEDPEFWDLFGKLDSRLGERHHLRAYALHAGDGLEFFEAIDGEQKRFDTDYKSSYLWLTHGATVGDRWLAETTVSASRIDRDRFGAEDEDEQSFQVVDRRTADILGLAHSWSFQSSPRHSLRAGFEARRYDSAYEYSNELETDFFFSGPGVEPREGVPRFDRDFRGEHLGVWVADRFTPLEPLTVELGGRFDRHTLTGDTLFSPRLSTAWRLGEASVLRASWGHFFQSQRPYELGVEDGETRFSPAERSEHWVLGYERQFGRGDRAPLQVLRAELFRRRVRDPRPRHENLFEPINTFPEAERDRIRITPAETDAQGVELVLRGAAGPRLDWWTSYSYATVEDELGAEQDARRLIDQPHALSLVADYRLGARWSVSLAWRYHTGWPTTPVTLETEIDDEGEEELVPVLGPLNSERLPSYHRMDLRASRIWQLRRGGLLTFFVDVQNLYDRPNVAGFDYSIDEDAGRLIAENEGWPGIFPSAGVRWEF